MQPDQKHSAMAAMGCNLHLAAGCQHANPAVLHHANPASGAAHLCCSLCCPSLLLALLPISAARSAAHPCCSLCCPSLQLALLPMPAAHACCPQVPGIKPEFAEAVLSAQQDPFFKANM